MKATLSAAAAAAALAVTVSLASAQTMLIERPAPGYIELSPEQRTIIYRHVARERPVVVVPEMELRVGMPVPPAVELHPLPEEVYVEVPTVRRYRYFHVHDRIVLVDPATSEIVEIIRD